MTVLQRVKWFLKRVFQFELSVGSYVCYSGPARLITVRVVYIVYHQQFPFVKRELRRHNAQMLYRVYCDT